MPTWLGIDIDGGSVKAAVVRSTYRKLGLVRLASAEIGPEGSVVDAVRTAVARAMEGERQVADATAVAIEGARAAVHRLSMPAAAHKQLAEVLAYELEAQIPFELAGAVFDWRLLEPTGEDGQLPIVAVVARVDDVRARIDLVKEATGLEPERVGVGAFALAALAPFEPALAAIETVALVDLGSKASEVLVIEKGEAVFARTLSIGTEQIPDSAPRLARDLRLTFASHRAQGGAAPSAIFLCGGGAFLSGAEVYLSGSLEIPVRVLPAPELDVTELPPHALPEIPRYAKAIALSLSLAGRGAGMNLRRGPLAYERGFAWVRERIPILAGLAAVILVSFVFSAWARMHAVHADRDALQAALGTVTKDVLGTEATTAEAAQDSLSKETALNDEDPMPHADAFDVMVLLSQAIPTTMVHDVDELDVQKGHVTLRGIVGSIPDAQAITATLAEDRCLSDVKLKSTTQAVGTDRQKYVIEFELKCPEDVKAPPKKKGEASAGASGAASGQEASDMAGPILQMNARERRLVGVLGFVGALVLLLAVPFGLEALVRSSIAENEDLRQALADVQDARGRVRERQAKKDAISARYAKKAPALAGFLEQAARQQKLEVTDSTPLPDVPHGKKYVEHATDIHLKKTGMLALARFIEALEKSGYPVALTRMNLHKRSGEADSYDVAMGLSAYDRTDAPAAPPAGSAKP